MTDEKGAALLQRFRRLRRVSARLNMALGVRAVRLYRAGDLVCGISFESNLFYAPAPVAHTRHSSAIGKLANIEGVFHALSSRKGLPFTLEQRFNPVHPDLGSFPFCQPSFQRICGNLPGIPFEASESRKSRCSARASCRAGIRAGRVVEWFARYRQSALHCEKTGLTACAAAALIQSGFIHKMVRNPSWLAPVIFKFINIFLSYL